MAKAKTEYVCQACGGVANKWGGQCGDCGAWNTLVEQMAVAAPTAKANRASRFSGYAGAAGSTIQALSDIPDDDVTRIGTGLSEFDRVLGGGIVTGSVVLVGGEPGIGKSTLLLQACANISQVEKVLYISGEESMRQISMRGRRLHLPLEQINVLAETRLEAIIAAAQQSKPRVMIVDSIQTTYTDELQSAPGSVSQLRECGAALTRYAKESGTAIILVGHVTKDGSIAGPRQLEHQVDATLFFDGDSGGRYRVIRAFKNRFGAVNELGMFVMGDTGLQEVANPSAIFLSNHSSQPAGTAILSTMEGTRPILAEIQCLVDESRLGNPRRVCVGFDSNRLSMLLAILNRHAGLAMHDQDVYVNVVGGMRIQETGADLAMLASAISSFRDRPLEKDLLIFGEVGLTGELRPVPNGLERLKEAAKHGFTRAIIPKGNLSKQMPAGIKVEGVSRLNEAIDLFG